MTGLLRPGSCGGRWQQKAPEHLGDGLEARAGASSTHRDTANHCACFWTSTVNSGRSGKRRLVPLILADLAAELPAAEWPRASFCDPMCGGGAVALAAKAQGFEVYASDRAR